MKSKNEQLKIKWLHLSDIHILDSTDYNIQLRCYKRLPQLFNPDFIIVSGDFRHLKYNKSFSSAKTFLEMVLDIFELSKKDIFLVPGNHDATDETINGREESCLEKIINNAESIPDIPQNDIAYLKEAFAEYEAFVKEFYGNELDSEDLRITRPLDISCIPYKNINIILLNTALASCNDRFGENKEIVDMKTLSSIEIQNGFPAIAVGHHAPENLVESQRKLLHSILKQLNVSAYLCGDAHKESGMHLGKGLYENIPYFVCGKSVIQQGDNYSDVSVIGYSWDFEYVYVQVYEYENIDGKAEPGFHKSYAFYNEHDNPFSFKMLSSNTKGTEQIVRKKYDDHTSFDLEAFEQNKMNIKNELILPWMNRSISFDAVFPKIFIEPLFKSEKKRHNYTSCSNLIKKNTNKNIIITGDAGIGKSTLLQYIYLFKNNTPPRFLYIRAMSLIDDSPQANDYLYVKYVRDLLNGYIEEDGKIILLDCIDEVYIDNPEELNMLISKIQKLKKNYVWLGWREEHLSKNETDALMHTTSDKVILKKWNLKKSLKYVKIYAKETKQPSIKKEFNKLIAEDNNIASFAQNPFQLTLLVYLLENPKEIQAINHNWNSTELTLYLLYKYFIECWIDKEHTRNTSFTKKEEIIAYLCDISKTFYYTNNYVEISSNDSAICDLLIYIGSKSQHKAVEFCHRSLSAFFIANTILEALKKGGIPLSEVLLHPLKDDVTVFIKSASQTISDEEIICMQDNMIELYNKIIRYNGEFPIRNLSDDNLFCIKNGIIYLISRIKEVGDKPKNFLKEANKAEKDPYMKLTIAYGAATLGIKDIALEYAKEYSVNSISSFVTRSCSLVYYGDVQGDPYKYKDDCKVSWDKSRDIRLQHLLSDNEKDIRFRVLDVPLLYCFYASRDWKDVNLTDFRILKAAKIKGLNYNKEEESFLKQKLDELLLEYKKQLKSKILKNHK